MYPKELDIQRLTLVNYFMLKHGTKDEQYCKNCKRSVKGGGHKKSCIKKERSYSRMHKRGMGMIGVP